MKKGFTLIELLAVIVILAIILLIAAPIVTQLVKETRNEAAVRTAEFYVEAVEQAIMKKSMNEGKKYNPSLCSINNDGKLFCDGNLLEIEIDGNSPDDGMMLFENSKLIGAHLTYKKRTIVMDEKGNLVYKKIEDIEVCEPVTEETKTTGTVPEGNFAPGDEYICEVKPGTKYHFFVVGTEDDKISLILDRNINNDGTLVTEGIRKENAVDGIYNLTAWITKDDYEGSKGAACKYEACNMSGPITATNFLQDATKTWINIPDLDELYNDQGKRYIKYELTGKARLPKHEELHGEDKCLTYPENGNQYGGCSLWLTNYLDAAPGFVNGVGLKNIKGISGYWILDGEVNNMFRGQYIHYKGVFSSMEVHHDFLFGVRPVITIYKTNILQ